MSVNEGLRIEIEDDAVAAATHQLHEVESSPRDQMPDLVKTPTDSQAALV
jgi:hypothetical protein